MTLARQRRDWRAIWNQPSHLGSILTIAGLMMLALGLILNRVMPTTFYYQIGDYVAWALIWACIIFYWALYVVGGALVMMGVFRIVAIDHRG